MNSNLNSIKVMKVGICFSLLTLLYGFGLGAAFGVFEDKIKNHLNETAQPVLESHYNEDDLKKKKSY